jgi:hypothetical protein
MTQTGIADDVQNMNLPVTIWRLVKQYTWNSGQKSLYVSGFMTRHIVAPLPDYKTFDGKKYVLEGVYKTTTIAHKNADACRAGMYCKTRVIKITRQFRYGATVMKPPMYAVYVHIHPKP